MSDGPTFGRRRAADPVIAPMRAPSPRDLSPEAEAFRRDLATDQQPAPSDFSGWWRVQRGRRLFTRLLGVALLAPGLICFVVDTPLYVSIGLEAFGLAVNWWLRQERRRHLKAIATWDAPSEVK